ncbi:hypothetical protein UFOVP75_190 [uncultured Caudovirales phage]|uniref:Uncharacterized protein n=1 Tax=uncultured Caudovirales phage TaxID=2100421 RepID=A0A6J5L1B8_9CAUD|nr:hypothetical protein UFOVP75_190 [uncultured Caudovirales phage]
MAGHIADSKSISWCSPLWVTDAAKAVFGGGGIDLDPCANAGSIRRTGAYYNYTLPDNDGLVDSWEAVDGVAIQSIYVNPPFGSYYMNLLTKHIVMGKEYRQMVEEGHDMKAYKKLGIEDWRKRCAEVAAKGIEIIHLGPANVETIPFQDYIEGTAQAIAYPRGRLYYEEVDSDGAILQTGPAPMASAIVYWGENPQTFKDAYLPFGSVHIL